MPRNLDIALLRTFDAIVDAGSITGAARLLHLTQAAASLQLKRLESVFRCQLIERGRRPLRLTPQGERLLAQARRLLRSNDDVWAAMNAPEFAGDVRLGMPSDLVRPYGTPVLRRFGRAHPRVRVSIVCDTTGRLLDMLGRGEIDLTMAVQTDCAQHGETLRTDPLVWVGSRDGDAFWRDPLPIATGDDTCPHRPVALKALAEAGRDWRFICEVSSFEPICATVEADMAVSPMLASTVPDSLRILDDASGLPRLSAFSVNLYCRRSAMSEVAEELARHIRAQLSA